MGDEQRGDAEFAVQFLISSRVCTRSQVQVDNA
jgi:hypothetical protein